MIRFALRLATSAVIALAAGAALAQGVDPEIIRDQAGTYLIAPENGAPGCRLTLQTDEAIGGYAISGAENCAKALPALAESYSWYLSGGVTIIDATRKPLAQFIENEGAPLKTEGDHPLLMLPAPKGIDRLPTYKSLAGHWAMQRPGGETLCTITLDGKPGDGDNATMSPAGDCAQSVAKLRFSLWHIEGIGLVMMSDDGESLSFDMRGDGNFEKSKEEGGKPLLLIRR